MPDGKTPGLNLARQITAESSARKIGFYKSFFFDALTIASAAGLGYSYRGFLRGDYGPGLLLGAAGIFLIFSVLQSFFTKNFARRFLVLLLQGFAAFLFFSDYNYRFLSVSAALFLILPFFGEILARSELGNAMEIKFLKAARPVLAKWTTALIAISIILYLPQWDAEKSFVSRSGFQGFYDWAAGLAGSIYPDIKFGSSFGELASDFAELQLKKDPAFKNLSPFAQEQILQETARSATEGLSETLGFPIESESSVSDTLYNLLIALFKGWHAKFGDFFLWGWGLAVFFIVRGLGTIFYWAISLLAFMIYQMLLASNFVHIVGETRTKEVIEW